MHQIKNNIFYWDERSSLFVIKLRFQKLLFKFLLNIEKDSYI
nr:MAG TPA: hypothetical protein [Caudoviricetes sp.]